MSNLKISKLQEFLQYLKSIKVKLTPELPNYGNYALFYNTNEISTGLINNELELKINLITGNFHCYSAVHVRGTTYSLSSNDNQNFSITSGKDTVEFDFAETNPIDLDELTRFNNYAKKAYESLEIYRTSHSGNYSQVYLWPHNIDFDLVWYFVGDQQIDLGISPGDIEYENPYIYITPKPFNDKIVDIKIPVGSWKTDTWKGIRVDWRDLVNRDQSEIQSILHELFEICKRNFD